LKLSILEKELSLLRLYKIPIPQYDSLEVEAQNISFKQGSRARTIPAQIQMDGLKKFGGQLNGPYTFCVSSPTHDGYAKFIGSWWFLRWLEANKDGRPIWHSINGSYYDHLRDRKPVATGLIISGVIKGSSSIKQEKLRDILDQYHGIPKVVLTSDEDPLTFFDRIKYPLNSCIWLGTKSKRKTEHL
jgi:hypothetical protein